MADVAVVSRLVKKLDPKKNRSFKGLKDDMEKLYVILPRAGEALKSVDKKHLEENESITIKNNANELVRTLYDMDDFVEDVRTYERTFLTGKLIPKVVGSKNIRPKLEEFMRKLEDYIKKISIGHPLKSSEKSDDVMIWLDRGQTSSTKIDQDLDYNFRLGQLAAETIKKLVLIDPAPVVAIWGLGGLGKTKLVQRVCYQGEVRSHFHLFAWVLIPEYFDAKSLMQSILCQLLPADVEDIKKMSYIKLTERLYKAQQERPCLIVICSLRRREHWQALRTAFPGLGPLRSRSKILLTTRDKEVIPYADQHKVASLYEIKPLGEAESLEVLKAANLGLGGEKMDEIVRLCRGSPLAIDILTAYFNSNPSDWSAERIHHIKVEETNLERIVLSIVSLCYCALPQNLKSCFLYIALFPMDQGIQVDELYQLWIAEGLIPDYDTAERNLDQLVSRNLVQVLEQDAVPPKVCRWSRSCKIHSLVRNFCIDQAKEDNLYEVMPSVARDEASTPRAFNHSSNHTPYSGQSKLVARRLAINLKAYKAGAVFQEVSRHAKANPLRSISVFMPETPLEFTTITSDHPKILDASEVKRLRVLNFDGVHFLIWKLPEGIGKLVYLKCLSFRRCYLEELPSSIGDLYNLKTLDLRVKATCPMKIPDVLWKLTKLICLCFPVKHRSVASNGRLNLKGLEFIEILVNINTKVCDIGDLQEMKNLQSLDAIVPKSMKETLHMLTNSSTNLRSLALDVRNFYCYSDETLSILKDMLQINVLDVLYLEGHIKQFPSVRMSQRLTEIVLNGLELELENDPMKTFGRLPNLMSLSLLNNAYIGKEMTCDESSFLELRKLKLKNFLHLEKLTVKEGAMPKLSILTIEKCEQLQLPDELELAPALPELKLVSVPAAFENNFQVVGRRNST